MLLRCERRADALTLSLLGAGRLLTGDIRGARTIIDHLPEKLVTLDHGAGRCLVASASTLRRALPLPSGLGDVSRWLAGSAEQAALRTWLDQNEAQLIWDERRAEYVLTPDTGRR
jgi:hypothetical protein